MIDTGERQIAPTLEGIRRDHVARYFWTAELMPPGSRVADVACGVGYGSRILADAGHTVKAYDNSEQAIDYANQHYPHLNASYNVADAAVADFGTDAFDVAVCFETIEHLEDPLPMLMALHRASPRLIASVPNEERFPFKNYKFHHRHYTRPEFLALLQDAGWIVTGWYGQEGPESDVKPNMNGRTVIVTAERAEEGKQSVLPAPYHVAILGMGMSLYDYVTRAKVLGGKFKVADEVWGINTIGGIFHVDRLFHMDDLRVQEARAAARPDSNIAETLKWLKRFPAPIVTSIPHPDYPSTVAFPLEDVVNHYGYVYFNSTSAYAVAFALHIGVQELSLFGIDFTYENIHQGERGRGCVEFWLGLAVSKGVNLHIAENSTLMDAMVAKKDEPYGYDMVKVQIEKQPDGLAKITLVPRETPPTAEEIEQRYDHSKHPAERLQREARQAS